MSVLDRREALKALVTALPAAAACNAAKPLAAPRAPVAAARTPSWTPTLLTLEQALTLEDVAEQLVPETDTPGARAAGVPAYIESVARDVFDDEARAQFLAGLDALNAQAQASHALPFHACAAAEQQALLTVLATQIVREHEAAEREHRKAAHDAVALFWLEMRELTVKGYLRSRAGATRHFAYEPVPGEYQGCVALETVGKTWAL